MSFSQPLPLTNLQDCVRTEGDFDTLYGMIRNNPGKWEENATIIYSYRANELKYSYWQSFHQYVEICASVLAHTNERGQTLFLLACCNGRMEIVRDLLKYNVLAQVDKDGCNALNYAAYNGHEDVVKLLLPIMFKKFFNISVIANEFDLLHNPERIAVGKKIIACLLGEIFKSYPQTPDPIVTQIHEGTGINIAMAVAAAGTLQQIQYLADKKVDLSTKDKNGFNPVQYAAMFNDVSVLEYVLNQPGTTKVDTKNNEDNTAFMLAVRYGNKPTAEFLLSKGADPLCINKVGQTAFEIAHKELAIWTWQIQLTALLEHGISNLDYTAAEKSIFKGFQKFMEYSEAKQILIALIHQELLKIFTNSSIPTSNPSAAASLSSISLSESPSLENFKYLLRNLSAFISSKDDVYEGFIEQLMQNLGNSEGTLQHAASIFTELRKIDHHSSMQLLEARFYLKRNNVDKAWEILQSLQASLAAKVVVEILINHPQKIAQLQDTKFVVSCLNSLDGNSASDIKTKLNTLTKNMQTSRVSSSMAFDEILLLFRKKLFFKIIENFCKEPTAIVEKVWGRDTLLGEVKKAKSQVELQDLYSRCLFMYDTNQSLSLMTPDTKKNREAFKAALQNFEGELNPPVVIDETLVSMLEDKKAVVTRAKELAGGVHQYLLSNPDDKNIYAWYTKALSLEKKFLAPSGKDKTSEITDALDKVLEYSRCEYLPGLIKRASYIVLDFKTIMYEDILLHLRLHLEVLFHAHATIDQKAIARNEIMKLDNFIDKSLLDKFGTYKEPLEKIKFLAATVNDLELKASKKELELPTDLVKEINQKSSDNLQIRLGLLESKPIYAPPVTPPASPPTAPSAPLPPTIPFAECPTGDMPVVPGPSGIVASNEAPLPQTNPGAQPAQIEALMAMVSQMVALQNTLLIERMNTLEREHQDLKTKTQAQEAKIQTLEKDNQTLRNLLTNVSSLISTASSQLSVEPVTQSPLVSPQSGSMHAFLSAPHVEGAAANSPLGLTVVSQGHKPD
jgi:ankyrin repeat protein